MADDPHRDLLPVREGSCIDTCRSSILDSRERHAVCKLDRYQLEDRYLRLHDEVQRLKKLSNSQEDKIKRLGTKLLRVAATPRSCLATALDFNNDKNRLDSLELENSKLKDKIIVLRNQILNHTIVGRSPSRNRRIQICNSSGPTTCRSGIGRLKGSSSHLIHGREDEIDSQNFIAKIEELEMEKKEMTSKIADLENQLVNHKIGNQREKAAENVEYIRVWRQMKLQNEQLVSTQAANVSMTEQIRDLNALLEEKTRNNKEITNALLTEKKKFADMNEQLAKAKDSQLSLREKEEQIKDLTNEMKILHQHNSELLALSSKYSQVEFENVELKKKISEQLSDHQTLKSAFSNEQANFTALQAANEQLMGKLHDLQKNIDSLTIQLKSFQSQNERYERYRSEHEKVRTVDRQTNTISLAEKPVASSEDFVRRTEICINCCQNSRERVPRSPTKNFVDSEVQTENDLPENFKDSQGENIHKKSPISVVQHSPMRNPSIKQENVSGVLTPDEMLKILEQAQINTPLEVQNAARMRQIASTSSNNYVNSIEPGQGQSLSQLTKKHGRSMNNDPWKILLIMYRVLREFSDTNSPSSIIGKSNPFPTTSSRAPLKPGSINFGPNNIDYSDTKVNDDPTIEQAFSNFLDENNNAISAKIKQEEQRESPENIIFDNEKKSNDHLFGDIPRKSHEVSREYLKKENVDYSSNENLENCITRRHHRLNKFTETNGCTCNEDSKCSESEDCGYACVQSISKIEDDGLDGRLFHCRCDVVRNPFKNVVRDISTSIQNTFDSIHTSRTMRAEGTQDKSYKSWQRPHENKKLMNASSLEKNSKFIVCRKANSGDGVVFHQAGSYPMLVTNDQGLLEIHIICLQLSSTAPSILSAEENIHELSLFVSWDIWDQKTAFTPFLKYPQLNFNSSSIYRLPELFEFFDRVLGQSVCFRIHVSRPDKRDSYAVAQANLSLKDILDYPQNKLHYVENLTTVLPRSRGVDFGQLSLWIRLSCDLDKLRSFKNQRGISVDHSTLSKFETPKKETNGKIMHELSSESKLKRPSVSSRLHESVGKKLVNADRTSKGLSESSQIDNNIVFKARQHSRQSKDSGVIRLLPEASSAPRERPVLNATPINNTSPRVSSAADSYITISPSIVPQSDSSIIRAMDDEDATSSDFRNGEKNREIGSLNKLAMEEEARSKDDDIEKLETASINEFNDLIRNGTILSPRESSTSVQDLGTVITAGNWDEYKKRSLASQAKSSKPSILTTHAESRSGTSYLFSDRSISNNDDVILRIESLSLFQKCSLLEDPEIHQLYVEFSFLGYRGVDLETISVPKPTGNSPALFNYMRKFEIDEEQHPMQRSIMRAMMTENDNPMIKFIVVSEPLLEEMETKECMEVGYAYFDIRDHILSDRFKEVALTIMNVEQTEPIGILKITLLGADAIRRCISDL